MNKSTGDSRTDVKKDNFKNVGFKSKDRLKQVRSLRSRGDLNLLEKDKIINVDDNPYDVI